MGLLLTVLLAAGCVAKRMSVQELQARETELATQPPVAVETAQLALTDFQPYKVHVSDVLGVRMIGLQNDRYAVTQLQTRVDTQGSIHLPVVGPIKVADLTLTQAEEEIIKAHQAADIVKDLSVFVELVDVEGTTVMVMGAVARPGVIKLKANQRNPIYALNEAGGFGTFGVGTTAAISSGRVILKPIRPEREQVTYDFNNLNDVRRALLGPPLESGDVLLVEAAPANAVYVNGLVNLPGAIPIPNGSKLSVLKALSAAGWIKPYISVRDGILIRTLGNGEQVQVNLKLNDIIEGHEPDLALLPGDILRVPQTLETTAQEWAIQNILAGPFQVGVRYDPLQQYNTERAIQSNNQNNSFSNAVTQSLATGLPQLIVPTPTPVTR